MINITLDELKTFERHYRANLVNSVSGYKPAALIGTQNAKGQSNLAIFSSVVHLGADPALIGFIQRPVGISGDTYRNILETGWFTINQVTVAIMEQAHYTSAKFDKNLSEFTVCHLTEEYIAGFGAPFVAESPAKMGLKFIEEIPIQHNNTKLIIGAVQHICINEKILKSDGNVQLDEASIVSISGLENYYSPTKIASYPYAKTDAIPTFNR